MQEKNHTILGQVREDMRRCAARLADDMRDLADHGPEYVEDLGQLLAIANRIDRLAAVYKAAEALDDAPDIPAQRKAQARTTQEGGELVAFAPLWAEHREGLVQWASRRQYANVARQIELIDLLLEEEDRAGVLGALRVILDDLDGRAARRFVVKYRAAVRHMIGVLS